ncbi:class I SAM-dependent methyltransferase [Azospirillum sp. RWY-5-1]|uniref:Class I SAM-dependent methyltransferase n=1 Tax=Azospirillum oleiclasticum TaxID=2735135 RepID=A0ABX2TMH1_9PROT|nr:class I SAM-dependent methyltransferase [Azospirillum oleiclasticum]NYZ16481.1 class I SAM-dependent methyltransferase [Azospirillum oleiclasticum]NYZ24050.1 class I SAM-dependent methyltransferase [Azospirillum oleiclasticum]
MPEPVRRRALDLIAERVELAGKRIVDVGCGEGGLVRALVQRGARVTGVECGAEMLAAARAAEPAGDERYLEGVGQALPLPDGCADLVVFMNSLHHVPVPHMGAALAEAGRVLVPGGLALVNEPIADGAFFQLTRLVEDEVEVRAAALAAVRNACAAGLFTEQAEIVYLNPVRMESFEAFAARMGRIDAARKALVAEKAPLLRDLFHRLAEARDGAFHFDQPARLNILARA